jgi:hypothetical protein
MNIDKPRAAVILMRKVVEREFWLKPTLQHRLCERYCKARGIEVVGQLCELDDPRRDYKVLRMAVDKARAHNADIITLDNSHLMKSTPKYEKLREDMVASAVGLAESPCAPTSTAAPGRPASLGR